MAHHRRRAIAAPKCPRPWQGLSHLKLRSWGHGRGPSWHEKRFKGLLNVRTGAAEVWMFMERVQWGAVSTLEQWFKLSTGAYKAA